MQTSQYSQRRTSEFSRYMISAHNTNYVKYAGFDLKSMSSSLSEMLLMNQKVAKV